MSLIKKFTTVASGTLMSRLFGFIREMLMAAAVGTGPVADAFNAAFRFPNTFRRLFAEGAFNSAFVPLFAKQIEEDRESAKRFSEEVFGVLFSILFILTLILEFSMPTLVRYIIAPGFSDDPAKFNATIRFAIIMFPYLGCMSLAAMMAGMLNSLHRYFAAAIAPVFLNIILIAVLLWAWLTHQDVWHIGLGLSWGVMASGIVQLAIVWFATQNAGMKIGFRLPRFTKNVKRLLWLALPAAITGGITQINLLINTAIASGQAGAVSSLVYADRLYQLPLGVVGIAVATVLLPELSRALRSKKMEEAANLQNRSIEFTLFLTLPASAAFLIMSEPIVRLLFERGQFSAQSTSVVAILLSLYGLGLPAFVLIKAFIPGFFAREDTKTPMVFAGISVVVNISLALTLFPIISAPGIVIAEITAGWVNALLLFITLLRRGHWHHDHALLKRIPRLILAAAVMAVFIHYALEFLALPLSSSSPFLYQILAVLSVVFVAMIVYFSLAFVLGGTNISMIKRGLKRKP
ncbi:murein biosynthesis integral membrane protein MurJ [Bartonella tamiae]|uniref:Probable lipid II flippase MurJ n=1 Tax=Bartonella tamiae Th239 TaxID=1094558 RepID=J1JZ03_9HYPH|nr:murein biosynthesis integral membrane protein MurJ [Bartonella tamiae]EJF90342.1 integral membrane protein MviN [Bartonella tamiae Th239]EJF93717.1 integral membrane protein MviN [Bartonella tamiae Th307]